MSPGRESSLGCRLAVEGVVQWAVKFVLNSDFGSLPLVRAVFELSFLIDYDVRVAKEPTECTGIVNQLLVFKVMCEQVYRPLG